VSHQKLLRTRFLWPLALIALAGLYACDNGTNAVTGPANQSPTASINSPDDGTSFVEGSSIRFQGSATDAEDGSLSGSSLVWTSSVDGQIGTGGSFVNGALAVGNHTITLRATDTSGASGTASVSVTVTQAPPRNDPPNASISSPDDGAEFEEGDAVSFAGAATDPEDGPLTGSALGWESSLDGVIGGGASVSRDDLSIGSHVIRLVATDSGGKSDTASVSIEVKPFNESPSAAISAPADGASFVERTSIDFEGSATDSEDGALTGVSLTWTSNLDGSLGTGESISRDDLAVGAHTIRFIAADSQGKEDTATISVVITPRQPPSATIASPADGTSFQQGNPISFQGSATDPEDGPLTGGSLVWTSNLDGQTGTGVSFSRDDLTVGPHTIRLIATDSDGMADTAQVSITVTSAPPPNQKPTAFISSPGDGASFEAGTSISFTGSATDPEDGTLSGGSLVWRSSRDGQIGTSNSFVRSNLSVGSHVIRLIATDSQGLADTARVDITVTPANQPPSASISSPSNGASFDEGESIGFQGSATDPEDGPLTGGSLVWRSSLDGQLGTGPSFSRSDLTVGSHTIRLIATDSQGLADTASVSITVTAPPNQQPTATITSPTSGSDFLEGTSIDFEGSATDPEDGALVAGELVWESSINGVIGTGSSFSRNDLTVGTHTIRLIATDSQGLADTASVSITVNANQPPTASITSPADNSEFETGESVSFQGSGTDPEDGPLTGGSLVWESTLDDQIGTGESFARSDLSNGTHTIRLIATDALGKADTATVSITISHPFVSGFQIHVRYSVGTVPTSAQRAAVDAAVVRWEEILTDGLPDVDVEILTPFTCGGAPARQLAETVDDLIIFMAFDDIDGTGGILGSAGPCFLRSVAAGRLPFAGGMRFDNADLAFLESTGILDDVILHEMAHVIGLGTLWENSFWDLVREPSLGNPGADTYFIGSEALLAFDAVGGDSYTGGNKVPVENDTENFGAGSLDAHWRESVFDTELMSPAIDAGSNPISLVTIESLEDMGYAVDPGAADSYTLPSGGGIVLLGGTRIKLEDDVWRGPLFELDERGRIRPVDH
jgi:hypothetical protein